MKQLFPDRADGLCLPGARWTPNECSVTTKATANRLVLLCVEAVRERTLLRASLNSGKTKNSIACWIRRFCLRFDAFNELTQQHRQVTLQPRVRNCRSQIGFYAQRESEIFDRKNRNRVRLLLSGNDQVTGRIRGQSQCGLDVERVLKGLTDAGNTATVCQRYRRTR